MRAIVNIAAAILLAACVRPTPAGPATWEEAVVGGRGDGAFLVAEASLAPQPEGWYVLLAPGSAPRKIEPLERTVAARMLAGAGREDPRSIRAIVLQDPRTAALVEAQGMTLATPLAPLPGSERLRYGFPDHGLSVWLVPDDETPAGARILSIRAFDTTSQLTVAEVPRLEYAWVTDVYRAGERVAVVTGSRGKGASAHVVEAATVVDLRRAEARLVHGAGAVQYEKGHLAEAIALFRRAAEADPTWADAPYDEACALALDNRPKEAAERLEVAIRLDPVRMRQLANRDRDLAELRQIPAIRQRLGLVPPPRR